MLFSCLSTSLVSPRWLERIYRKIAKRYFHVFRPGSEWIFVDVLAPLVL